MRRKWIRKREREEDIRKEAMRGEKRKREERKVEGEMKGKRR